MVYGIDMARLARIVAVDTPHHVTPWGNKPTPPKQLRLRRPGRQDVFFADGDRECYMELLREHAERYGLRIMAYCLMTNHVHLVARKGRPLGSDKFLSIPGGRIGPPPARESRGPTEEEGRSTQKSLRKEKA